MTELTKRVLAGGAADKKEALGLVHAPLEQLCAAADRIRNARCGNVFDMCTIINGKSGLCPEDCKFCAQSARYADTQAQTYPLLDSDAMVAAAAHDAKRGVLRFSIVTSGRRLSKDEVRRVCNTIERIRREVGIEVCVSPGLLDEDDLRNLHAAGCSRLHCNLETSERFFAQVCTTHTWQAKVEVLQAALRVGLSICSGCIVGMGETWEDRVDLAIAVRDLGVRSIPLNLLAPIPGTPLADSVVLSNDEFCRIAAVFRFLIPDGFIRLAGGRGQLGDRGERALRSGANAAISGDMLTTAGYTVETDMEMLHRLGYEVRLQ